MNSAPPTSYYPDERRPSSMNGRRGEQQRAIVCWIAWFWS